MTPYRNCSRLDEFHPSSSLRTSIWARATIPVWAVFLLLILGGCPGTTEQGGPAGTSNLVVDLQSLQPSVGGLSPSFHPADQSYTVTVGPNTSAVSLTAVTTDSRAALKINDQPAVSGQPFGPIALNGSTTTVPIVVEAFGVSKDYQITITRQTTPDLQDLTASAGALSPAFDPATLAYTVTTGFSTSSTTVTATVVDDTARLTINGSSATSGVPSGPITLNPGSTVIPVVVTASNGQIKTYQVTIIRGNTADLASLETSAGPIAPVFSPSVQNYTVSTGFATTEATITVTTADSTATVTINSQAAQSGQAAGPFLLKEGANTFTIVVTAGSAGSKSYTLVITRTPADTDANLSGLSVSAGSLNPGFAPGTTSYTVITPNSTTSTTVTATTAKSTSSLTINGSPANSGLAFGPIGLNVGQTVITVVVTAQSGDKKQYQVTITREPLPCSASLTNLTINPGSLAFDPSTQNYTVNVGDTVGSVTVTATPQANTTVTINGQVTTSRSVTLNPAGQSTTIEVVVQCPDGSTTTYRITVNRQPPACNQNLGGLSLSAGVLSFDPNTTSYTVNVPNSTSSTTVTATLPAGSTSTLKINNQTVSSGQAFGPIALAVGNNTITVVVTCPDGTIGRTYTVTVIRQKGDADLTNLVVQRCFYNDGEVCANFQMQPMFNPMQLNYVVNVPYDVDGVRIVATKSASSSVVFINDVQTASLDVFLGNLGSDTVIRVVVRASDTVTTNTYTVTVKRAANGLLSNLVASFCAIQPAPFSSTTILYGCSRSVVGSTTITATAFNPLSKITLYPKTFPPAPLTSGQASAMYPIDTAVNQFIVSVESPEGFTMSYQITIGVK